MVLFGLVEEHVEMNAKTETLLVIEGNIIPGPKLYFKAVLGSNAKGRKGSLSGMHEFCN